MNAAIVGNRDLWPPLGFVESILSWHGLWHHGIITGDAGGVDSVVRHVCALNGIEPTVMVADWDAHGKKAGPIRNSLVVEAADVVVAIWDGQIRGTKGKGTKDVITKARAKGVPVFEYIVPRQ